jgi:hypothetical protein
VTPSRSDDPATRKKKCTGVKIFIALIHDTRAKLDELGFDLLGDRFAEILKQESEVWAHHPR